ncbi:hypothetical protein DWG20_09310 [Crenobacter cavernae]|uniref:Uncharacterized protein n=2 Tax=Crenobacter cavernae TaxID=2290923 RepID=A0A345Y6S3_9NEIS|nr:hypothetical protein DWG20_09310 [Crenobacter cavernae]
MINGEAHPEGSDVDLPEELADKMVGAGWAESAPAKAKKTPAKPADGTAPADDSGEPPADPATDPDAGVA